MKKILIIDDEEITLELLSSILENEGYEVLTALDGERGLQLFRDNPVDLVFTDMIMPKKDGLETILALRELDDCLPIVAISGGGEMVKDRYFKVAGFLENVKTIPKPFLKKEIMDVLQELLH